MPQFLADQNLRLIHWIDGGKANPCLESVAAPDRVAVEEEGDVKRMMELEAFQPCPNCMSDFPWTE